MGRLIRLLLYSAGSYFVFRVGFPNEGGSGVYHMVTIPILLGGAVGIFILLKAIDLGSKGIALAIELTFAAAVFLYLGFTLPQAKGKVPLLQLFDGEIPNRATARDGLKRLGLDPSGPAGVVTKIFPE